MPKAQYIRPSTDAENRARAREKVAALAKRGSRPSDWHDRQDLQWAFRGLEDELAALEEEAERVQSERAAQIRTKEQSHEVRKLADRIESELLAEEKRARRRKAEAEARKRLGLSREDAA